MITSQKSYTDERVGRYGAKSKSKSCHNWEAAGSQIQLKPQVKEDWVKGEQSAPGRKDYEPKNDNVELHSQEEEMSSVTECDKK